MEKNLDLKDLLATILEKWYVIIIFLVIGGLLGMGFCKIRSGRAAQAPVQSEDALAVARAGLSEEEIRKVDYLYAQYMSYQNYRYLLQDYLNDSLYPNDEVQEVCNTLYYVESGISNVESCYCTLALGAEEMEAISQILGADADQRVFIGCFNSTGLDSSDEYELNVFNYDENGEIHQRVLQVTVASNDRDQADQVMEVIDEAFADETESLRKLDPTISFEELGRQYSDNAAAFRTARMKGIIESLNNAGKWLTTLEYDHVDVLSKSERVYFDALMSNGEVQAAASSGPSLKKYVIAGIVAGFLAGLILVILWYIFNGRVKTMLDVTQHTKLKSPYVVGHKRSGFHLFGPVARRLRGTDLKESEVRQELVNNHLAIHLSRMECKSVYIAMDNPAPWKTEEVEKLKKVLADTDPAMTVSCGNPMTDTGDLRKLSESGAVILLIQLKNTPFQMLDKWMDLNRQYDQQIAGVIVMEEC